MQQLSGRRSCEMTVQGSSSTLAGLSPSRGSAHAVWLIVGWSLAWCVVLSWSPAAAQTGASYTTDQAEAGRLVFERSCATCHMDDLSGAFEAPELAGPNFRAAWVARPVGELVDLISGSMPPGQGGLLSDQAYGDVVAYILQANGVVASAGPERLVSATDERSVRARSESLISEDGAVTTTYSSLTNFAPVTDAMLREPDPDDWLNYRRTYNGWGYSPLSQITRDNVHRLSLAWTWAMPVGSNQPTPLVYDGILYLVNPGNVIQAFDAATGTLRWEYRRLLPESLRTGLLRNLAIYEDKLFLASRDAYLVALDARTGELVWETRIADYQQGYTNSAGPIVADGKVINAINGCARFQPDSCFITAHDARTGEELWRTLTIAQPGTPGGDTWGDLSLTLRGGGDSWIAGSYDPSLGLVYWPVAQAKPWVPASRGLTVHDAALYTNATLAIDPDDGSIRWYFQHVPGEALDLDESFEKVLVDDSQGRKALLTIGKSGILWKLDRESGAFLGHTETVYQNVFEHIDPMTGAITYRRDIAEAGIGDWVSVCPSTAGGHNWQAMAFSPEARAVVIPLSQSCLEIAGREVALVQGSGGSQADRKWFEMPGTAGRLGKVAAYDVDTLEELWSIEQRASVLTAMLTTGGGLVFFGDVDRYFRAVDVGTGDLRWETRLGTSVQGFPVTFRAGGEQFIAVTAGVGGGSPRRVPMLLSPEIRHPTEGNALYVFKLAPNRRR